MTEPVHEVDYGDERLPQRFWDKVYPCPVTGCWHWGAAFHASNRAKSNRYGKFSFEGRFRSSHILTGTLKFGPQPSSREFDHLCRVTLCCNPAHLEPVTHLVNVRRGVRARGESPICKNGLHEMTPENTYRHPSSKNRQCVACKRNSMRRFKAARKKPPPPPSLACGRGHAYRHGTYTAFPGNGRKCRACSSAQDSVRRAAARGYVVDMQTESDRYYSMFMAEAEELGEPRAIRPRRKLTEEIVTEVRRRRAAGEKVNSLAEEYGVSRHTINDAIAGRRWGHVV